MIAIIKYILSYNIIKLLFIYNYYLNETYHVNKGVIVSIIDIASTITLALPKADNNNNNIYIYIYIYIYI